jgi:nucleotide-binding universal stress UspA family protein
MSEREWERNTAGMVGHAKQRSEAARERVDRAIAVLLREGKPVSFNSVADAAGVSRAYLYGQPALRERIAGLRGDQDAARLRRRAQATRTDESQRVLLAAKDRRIRQLEEENRRLKAEL